MSDTIYWKECLKQKISNITRQVHSVATVHFHHLKALVFAWRELHHDLLVQCDTAKLPWEQSSGSFSYLRLRSVVLYGLSPFLWLSPTGNDRADLFCHGCLSRVTLTHNIKFENPRPFINRPCRATRRKDVRDAINSYGDADCFNPHRGHFSRPRSFLSWSVHFRGLLIRWRGFIEASCQRWRKGSTTCHRANQMHCLRGDERCRCHP